MSMSPTFTYIARRSSVLVVRGRSADSVGEGTRPRKRPARRWPSPETALRGTSYFFLASRRPPGTYAPGSELPRTMHVARGCASWAWWSVRDSEHEDGGDDGDREAGQPGARGGSAARDPAREGEPER